MPPIKQKFLLEIETELYGSNPWTEEQVKVAYRSGSVVEEFNLISVKEIKDAV